MKKLIAMLLVLTMVLSFAACAKKDAGMSHADYVAAANDTEVVVETYVQAHQSWWDNKATVYTQDADGACRAGPDAVLLKLSCERRESAAYRAVCGGGAQPGRGCFISFARRDLSCAVCGGACKYIRADGLVACRADGGGAFSALRALSFIPRKEKRKNSFAGGIKRGIIF